MLNEWIDIANSSEFKEYDPQQRAIIKAQWFKDNYANTPEFQSYSEDDQVKILNGFAAQYNDQIPPRTFMGTLGDLGISVAKGIVQTGEFAVGLADIPTGGLIGKAMHDYLGYDPQETQRILEQGLSPAQQAANRRVEAAKGFTGTVKAMIENPSTIVSSAVESLPSMLGGGAIARKLLQAGWVASPLIAAAIGEGAVSAGQQAEQIRQETPSGYLTPGQSLSAVAAGIGTGIFNLVGGRIAKRLGFEDPDLLAAGLRSGYTKDELMNLSQEALDQVKKNASKGIARRMLEGGFSEGVLEELPQSVQEQIWTNAALGRPLMEGVPQAGAQGILVGGMMGAGANVITRKDAENRIADSGNVDEAVNAFKAATQPEASPAPFGFPKQTEEEQAAMQDDIERQQKEAPIIQKQTEERARSIALQAEIQKARERRQAEMNREADTERRQSELTAEIQRARERNQRQIDRTNIEKLNEFDRLAYEGRKWRERTPGGIQNAEEGRAQTGKTGREEGAQGEEQGQLRLRDNEQVGDLERRDEQDQEKASLDAAANEAATSPLNETPQPTEAQKEAGNYKKGHINIQGMDITVENPEGSTRSGKDEDGKVWESTMHGHYGYFKRSEGKDGEQIDVFVGPDPQSQKAYIVDQINPKTGKFDEHKVVMGVDSEQAARELYLYNYEPGWQGLGAISEISTTDLKEWIEQGRQRQPFGDFKAGPSPAAAPPQGTKLSPSVGEIITDELTEDLSNKSTASNEFKRFMSDYGMTRSGAIEVKKAQMNGESITLQEAQNRGDSADTERQKRREYYFSEEGQKEAEAEHQERLAKDQQEINKAFKDADGENIEDGFYEDENIGIVYEIRTDPKTGNRSIFFGKQGSDLDLFGRIKDGNADQNSVALATLIRDGEIIKRISAPDRRSEPRGPDRRQDTEQRKRIAEMSAEEARHELSRDPSGLTNLMSNRAYEELEKKPVQVMFDMDGLGFINDYVSGGHEAGNAAITLFGEAIENSSLGADGVHFSGDEFGTQAINKIQSEKAVAEIRQYLKNNPMDITIDGTDYKLVLSFSTGTGATKNDADKNLILRKREKETQGERPAKGTGLAGVTPKTGKRLPGNLYTVPGKGTLKQEIKKARKKTNTGPQTLRGRIKQAGYLNKLNFKGEFNNLPLASKLMFRKTGGMPIDTAEEAFKSEGWISPDASLIDMLNDPEVLKRGMWKSTGAETKTASQRAQDRKLERESIYEPEGPPQGDYVTMKASDLPEGKKLTIIEGNTRDGWDEYEVIDSDPFSVTLKDGTTLELASTDEVQVRVEDFPKDVSTAKQQELIKEEPELFEDQQKQKKPNKIKKESSKSDQEQNQLFGYNQTDMFGSSTAIGSISKKLKDQTGSSQILTDVVNLFAKPQTESKQFKEWFGDSKVVDENGAPLVVFHWTDSEFESFDTEGTGGSHFGTKRAAWDRARGMENIEYEIDEDEDGFWVFADSGPTQGEGQGPFKSESEANKFIKKQPQKIDPLPVYLSIHNPVKMPDLGVWNFGSIREQLLTQDTITQKEADYIWSEWNKNDSAGWTALKSIMSKKGYDGIAYTNEQEDPGSLSYVALEPTQIKSAISNTGSFDPNNPSIRGDSQMLTDIVNYGIELKEKFKNSYPRWHLAMREKFLDIWDKIKKHMHNLWRILNNKRGEIRLDFTKSQGTTAIQPGFWGFPYNEMPPELKPKKQAPEPVKFEESLKPITEQDYIENRKSRGNVKLAVEANMSRVKSEVKEIADKYLGAISTRLGNVSEKLKSKLRKLDYDTMKKSAADIKAVLPMLQKAKSKMTKEDFADWDYARKNSDTEKINELIEKYDLRNEYDKYRSVLDAIRKDALDVGLSVGLIDEYAPRVIKDSKGFLNAMGKDDEWPIYSRRLRERAAELGISIDEMTPDMKAGLISNMILTGYMGIGAPPATKQRKLKKIPPALNRFYMDSDSALMSHIHSMRKNIEARRFFGKIPEKVAEIRKRLHLAQTKLRELNNQLKDNSLDDLERDKLEKRRNKYFGLTQQYWAYLEKYALQRDYRQNIGTYIMELIDKKEIRPRDERIVNEILTARFHEHGTRGIVQAYKNLSYMDTMGSPISALTQIGDLAWAAYEGGFIPALRHTYRAIRGQSKITKEDVGVERIAQEFADSGTLSKAVSKVFKYVGLEKMDSIGKEALLNAALENYQNQAKKNPEKLKAKLFKIFEDQTDDLISDLKTGAITDNVKLLVYSRLLDFQPVALSEMPEKYLSAGNGRLFYMLKTFTLKQFDVCRNEVYNNIRHGTKAEKIQGFKNLVRLSMFFVLANAGADELKDWVLGRKTDFKDRVVDNALRLFGVSKYITWQARTEGVGTALAKQILPPFKFVDSLGKDIMHAGDEKGLEVVGSIPLVGKLAYWHMGRGVSKRGELWDLRWRRKKRELMSVKQRLDESDDPIGFRLRHRTELAELNRMNQIQGQLNAWRRRINQLKKMGMTAARESTIEKLKKRRIDLIKRILNERN